MMRSLNDTKTAIVAKKLLKRFSYDLFLYSDINLSDYDVTDAEMNAILDQLQQQEKLTDFGVGGVYQFVRWTYELGFPLEDCAGPEEVTYFLYLKDNSGYFYGNDLLLYLNLSDQVSRMKTVASNKVNKEQYLKVRNADLFVKPALAKVTAKNKCFLQAVETILTPGMLSVEGFTAQEVVERLAEYAMKSHLSITEVKDIILGLPDKKIEKILSTGFLKYLENG